MYTINPGEFKHPIEIKRYAADGVDEDNIPKEGYTTVITTKAKIINVSGKETIIANTDIPIVTKLFKIRYPKGIEITTKDKVLYKEKLYNITYVSDIEDLNKYLEIVCELVG